MTHWPIPIMFADSIDGGILMILIFGCGLVASLVALIALFPASQGNKLMTLCLIAPALIAAVGETCWIAYGFFQDKRLGSDLDFVHNLMLPWFFLAGGPFFTSLLGVMILFMKRRKNQ